MESRMRYQDIFKSIYDLLRDVGTSGNYQYRCIFVASIILLVFSLIAKGIKCFVRKPSSKRVRLGRLPIHEITDRNQIFREIHYAAWRCCEEPAMVERCIALLNKYPAAVNLPLLKDGYTPFLRACYNGSHDLISYMLLNGADINSTSSSGDNALYLATYSIVTGRCNTYAPLKNLIAAERAGGYTALHLAAARGHSALVRWLLSRGADPAPRSIHSPYRIALERGHLETASLLRVETDEEYLNCSSREPHSTLQ